MTTRAAAARAKAQKQLQEAEHHEEEQRHEEEKEEDNVEEPVSGSDDEEAHEEENEQEEDGDDNDSDDGSDGAGDADEFPADGEDDEEPEEELEAVGFGDAMSKILQQNVASDAQPILAKRTTARMREIMNEKKEIKKERVGAAEKRAKERKDNVVPSVMTAAKDRQLRKIATKGVVALFNAISKHQHQTGKVENKDDKKVKELSKENFLGLLKSAATQKGSSASAAKAEPAKSSWSVLQDDYMMGAKLKDWDATHNNDAGRRRNGDKAEDDSDPEAAEEKAWKQVADMDSDDDAPASKGSSKRQSSGKPTPQKKKVKRS